MNLNAASLLKHVDETSFPRTGLEENLRQILPLRIKFSSIRMGLDLMPIWRHALCAT